jgi:hypothetical protein
MIKGFHLDGAATSVFSFTFRNCVLCNLLASFFVFVERPWLNIYHKGLGASPNCYICIWGRNTIQFVCMQTHCWYNFNVAIIRYWKEVAFYFETIGQRNRLNKKKFLRQLVNFVKTGKLRTKAWGSVTRKGGAAERLRMMCVGFNTRRGRTGLNMMD